MAEDEAIFNGAGLTFVGVADDVFDGIELLADEIPLHPSGKAGTAHAAQFGFFESGEDSVRIARGEQVAQRAVFLAVAVRIGGARDSRRLRVTRMQLFAAGSTTGELLDLVGGNVVENHVVDGDSGGAIAAAEATDIFQLHVLRTCIGETAQQFRAQFAGTIQAAAHVGADVNFRSRRRRKMKMGVETGDTVELVERSLRALRQGFQFRLGQIAAAQLDGSQFVKNHGSVGSRTRAPAVKPRGADKV
jgi:hypothetical protein